MELINSHASAANQNAELLLLGELGWIFLACW